jgi:hypothetical protein
VGFVALVAAGPGSPLPSSTGSLVAQLSVRQLEADQRSYSMSASTVAGEISERATAAAAARVLALRASLAR